MPAFLVQVDGYDPVAAAAVSLRAASVDDDRVSHVDGANGVFWPAIAQLPELRYDLVDAGFSGRIDTPGSQIVFAVEPFPLLPRYNLSDARVRIWIGNAGDAWGSYILRADCRSTAQPAISGGLATLPIAVDDRWLDTPLLALYAGTTGAEGTAAQKGRPKPLSLGAPRFAPAELIDPTNLVLQLSAYGAIEDVEVAFERILRFGAAVADHATYAALIAATVRPGEWATAKAVGMVRHGAPPVPGGRFCYHVKGDKGGPDGWVRLPGAVIKRIALIAGGTGRFSEASVDALDAARPWNISWHIAEQITAREAIQRIAASVNAVAGVSWLSQLCVPPLPSLIGSPAVTLNTDGTTLPPVGKVEQIAMDPPFWQMAIQTERTWDVHGSSEIAFTAILVDRGDYVAAETYREGHIVKNQNILWLYTNPSPSAGNAPPTLPASSNSWWRSMSATQGTDIGVANGAGTTLTIVPVAATVEAVGNATRRQSGTDAWDAGWNSTDSIAQGCFLQWTHSVAVTTYMVGLTDVPITNAGNNYGQIDYAVSINSTTLDVYRNGVGESLGATVAVGDVLSVIYNNASIRLYRYTPSTNTNTLIHTYATTPGRRFMACGTHYTTTGLASYPAKGIRFETFSNQNWPDMVGTGLPANNAGTTVNLTAIGTETMTITGNSFFKTGTVGHTGGVRGDAIVGPQFAEMDIASAASGAYTLCCFDSAAPDYQPAVNILIYVQYNSSGGGFAIYSDSTLIHSSTIAAGITGKLLITYDGTFFRAFVGGTQYGGELAAAADLKLWPKWLSYDTGITFTGLNAGPSSVASSAEIMGLVDLPILCDSAGVVSTGQYDQAWQFRLRDQGVDVTTGVTWTRTTPTGVTTAISGSGLGTLSLSAFPGDNVEVEISAARTGKPTIKHKVKFSKQLAPPASGNTLPNNQTSAFTNVSSGTAAVISADLTIVTGASGNAYFQTALTVRPARSSPVGNWYLRFQWERWNGSAWVTQGATFDASVASIVLDGEGVVYMVDPEGFASNYQTYSPGAGATVKMRLTAWIISGTSTNTTKVCSFFGQIGLTT